MNKKLSVVITAYNEEKYISECIESVISQTYRNLDIIVVDDGSRDKTASVAETFTEKDTRVRVVRKDNGGSVSARKEGLKYATGEYITYIDGDDWLETDHYEKIMSEMDDADIIAFSLTCVYEGNRREIISNEAKSGIYTDEKLEELKKSVLFSGQLGRFGLFPSMCAKVFKKSLVEENLPRVHDDIRMGDDGACTFPSVCDAKKIIIDNDIAGYLYRKTETGTLTSSFNCIEFSRIENLYDVLCNAFSDRFKVKTAYKNAESDVPLEKGVIADNMYDQLAFYLMFLYRTEMIQELAYLKPGNALKKYREVSNIYKLKWVQFLLDYFNKNELANDYIDEKTRNSYINNIESVLDKESKIFITSKSTFSLFWNWYIVRKL